MGVGRGMGVAGLVRVGVAQSKLVAVWVGVVWVGVGLCISLGLEDRLDQAGEDRSAGVQHGVGEPVSFLAQFL